MTENKAFISLFLSVVVNQLWYLMPELPPRDYFLFSDMQLTIQTHVFFACLYISNMFMIMALGFMMPKYPKTFTFFILLEAVCFVQYLLCYGQSFLPGIDMNTVKLILYGLVLFHNMLKNSVTYVKTS